MIESIVSWQWFYFPFRLYILALCLTSESATNYSTIVNGRNSTTTTSNKTPTEFILSSNISSFEEWKTTKCSSSSPNGKRSPNDTSQTTKHNHTIPPAAASHDNSVPQKNYASTSCGSKIVESSADSKYAKNILQDSLDSYMLCPRKTEMWFVVQLCEFIQITHIELGTFELFVNLPKTVEIRSSDEKTYTPLAKQNKSASVFVQDHSESEMVKPKSYWDHRPILGVFECENERRLHRFASNQTLLYSKYIRVDILDSYGHEKNCALSSLRVFGRAVDEHVDLEPTELDDRDFRVEVVETKRDCPFLCQLSARFSYSNQSMNPLISPRVYFELISMSGSSFYSKNCSPNQKIPHTKQTNSSEETHARSNNIPPIVRLSQKIQRLEMNVSLTSVYLEKLSKHYKLHIERLTTLLDSFRNQSADMYTSHSQETRDFVFALNESLKRIEAKCAKDLREAYLLVKLMGFALCVFAGSLMIVLSSRNLRTAQKA